MTSTLKTVLFHKLVFIIIVPAFSFFPGANHNIITLSTSARNMVDGKPGWDNSNFLESLSGNDRNKTIAANEEYEEYKRSRIAFAERQRKLMENDEVREYMMQREERRLMRQLQEEKDEWENGKENVGGTSGRFGSKNGGNRLNQLGQQAAPQDLFGFDQKFAPIDDESEEQGFMP
eukprot:CAMPEP_0172495642 /NCGR_PEP_ID=MMETSP1066-20121228/73616_1 /TAXON_ID=671091 /ORGANISM="Coscinodiscus wailesii, Strain CCMP2513" /LENGTH=175 /DNA_ID=CAMNT_0013267441 /DNA_START=41 /DNA_END=568 /DNA_ORIENTATION=+